MATLQAAHVAFRRLPAAGALTLAWSAVGVHREAEFAKSHGPAFMYGKQPRTWLTVYPFVRLVRVVPAAGRSAPRDAA